MNHIGHAACVKIAIQTIWKRDPDINPLALIMRSDAVALDLLHDQVKDLTPEEQLEAYRAEACDLAWYALPADFERVFDKVPKEVFERRGKVYGDTHLLE